MLWYLWSQNRQEVSEGTYSHDTAYKAESESAAISWVVLSVRSCVLNCCAPNLLKRTGH